MVISVKAKTLSYSTLKESVNQFRQTVSNPKIKLDPKGVQESVRKLEASIVSFTGGKSDFLPLLYNYNLARRKIAKFLPKEAPQIFLPDYTKKPKDLAEMVTKIGTTFVRQPDPCWQKLVAGVCQQANKVLTLKNDPKKGVPKDKVELFNRLDGSLSILSPTAKNIQTFNAYHKAFRGLGIPMQFAIHNVLVDLEKSVKVKDLRSFIQKYNNYLEIYGEHFQTALEEHPPLNEKMRSIMKTFFLRGGMIAAGALGNIAVAYFYGILPSIVTGVATQALLNYRKVSKAGLTAGAVQGLAAYGLPLAIRGLSFLSSVEIPLGKNYSTGITSAIGFGSSALSILKAVRTKNCVGAITAAISMIPLLWFGVQKNNPVQT